VASSCASETPALEVEGLACRHAGAARPVLADVELRLRRGECVWLGGPSGAGKTTLLRAVAGALPPGSAREGRVHATGGRPALLFQNVETQLLCTTAREEVGFGLEGLAPDTRADRTERALAGVGLGGFASRAVETLSAGEKQRLVLAALLAREPRVLLLDEPSSQLDPDGRRRLVALLDALKRRGHALLVADHLWEPYAALADRRIGLKEGRLAEPPEPHPPGARLAPRTRRWTGDETLAIEALEVRGEEGEPLLRDVSLRVARGERVHVAGRNGAGKSTLLRAAAGFASPARGTVRVGGDAPARAPLGRIGFLFQSPERNLFERSVREEVGFTLRRLGAPAAEREARVDELLARLDLAPLADRSPLRLSFGEQHRVALAALLAPRPALLLLDEPFAGLDLPARARLLEVIAHEQEGRPAAVVVASHDPLPVAGFAERELRLGRGRAHDA
jgi:energy-coupling factor transport system ATP-binding protein